DEALAIANGTMYGLTGAVYTRNPEKIERARREFFVGNLYINRKCTGAIVGAHPFGGFNMSGTDSKAGGRDYLLLFMQAKSVAKKIKEKSAGKASKKKSSAKKIKAMKASTNGSAATNGRNGHAKSRRKSSRRVL